MVTRMIYKPRVKEGPWWGRQLRAATWADMAAYVSVKNLIIGAALLLAMKGIGVLQWLHAMPELRWLY
jgi:NosR/NirI family nitrous oxide reductase transcriptional regulator